MNTKLDSAVKKTMANKQTVFESILKPGSTKVDKVGATKLIDLAEIAEAQGLHIDRILAMKTGSINTERINYAINRVETRR